MGWLSGYPIGAKIAVNLRNNNICSKEDCERLLSFTNNSGPAFYLDFGKINLIPLKNIKHQNLKTSYKMYHFLILEKF